MALRGKHKSYECVFGGILTMHFRSVFKLIYTEETDCEFRATIEIRVIPSKFRWSLNQRLYSGSEITAATTAAAWLEQWTNE